MNKRLFTVLVLVTFLLVFLLVADKGIPVSAGFSTNTYLSKAVSITTHKDKLLIADNVDGNGVLHIFDEASNGKFTGLTGEIVQIVSTQNYVYVLQKNSLVTLAAIDGKTFTVVQTMSLGSHNILQIAVSETYLYFLVKDSSSDSIKRMEQSQLSSAAAIVSSTWFGRLKGATSLAFAGGWLNVLTDEGILARNEVNGDEAEILLKPSTQYLTSYGENLFQVGTHTIDGILVDGNVVLTQVYHTSATKFYALCGDGKVRQFQKTETGYEDLKVLLGSSEVNIALPFNHVSDTLQNPVLASSAGYPSNVLYEPAQLADSALKHSYRVLGDETFLILNYNASEDAQYYYIFFDGKFGFVEISEQITIHETVSPLIKTQINSHQTLNVYSLPDEKLPYRLYAYATDVQVSISATIHSFTSRNNSKWCFATVTDGTVTTKGFVLSADLKPDTTSGSVTYKFAYANPSIGEGVSVFSDVNGEEFLSLRSGERVRVYYVAGEHSFVRYYINETDFIEGYVLNSKIIYSGLTHNQTLGLALFLAFLLLLTFVIVVTVRRKKIRRNYKSPE